MVRKRRLLPVESSVSEEYIPCFIKEIESDADWLAAAQFASECNAVNRPNIQAFAALDVEPDRFAIAVMTTKYFGQGGVKLSVAFVSQASAALQDKILLHMNAASTFCNIKFTLFQGTASGADVRISLAGGGYWSYLGTDVLRIPRNQPTMNLQGFSLNTPESEYRRVVRHETFHTLGCPHEHMRREIVDRLHVQRTIAYFARRQNWNEQEVRQQVLTSIDERSIMGTLHAEIDSLMCYGLPAEITIDGIAIPGGIDITPTDAAFMASIYPLPIAPLPPPPPPPSATEIIIPRAGTYRLVA